MHLYNTGIYSNGIYFYNKYHSEWTCEYIHATIIKSMFI